VVKEQNTCKEGSKEKAHLNSDPLEVRGQIVLNALWLQGLVVVPGFLAVLRRALVMELDKTSFSLCLAQLRQPPAEDSATSNWLLKI
jgi:hypothetical protein